MNVCPISAASLSLHTFCTKSFGLVPITVCTYHIFHWLAQKKKNNKQKRKGKKKKKKEKTEKEKKKKKKKKKKQRF